MRLGHGVQIRVEEKRMMSGDQIGKVGEGLKKPRYVGAVSAHSECGKF